MEKVLAWAPVEGGRAALAIDGSAGEPAGVKLYRRDLLLDVVPLSGVRAPAGSQGCEE